MSLLSPGLRLWEGVPMANTKKMVIAVYGNLYIGNIDTEKLHSQGGFLVTATNEEIQKAIKDIYWLDVRVIRQDIRYENILLGDDVQLCVYATGDIQVGSRMMSTRSVSLSLDYPAFYAIQGSILNAPLNPQEVYKLLGIGKHKGEWWDITYICSNNHGKTNKWSNKKPIRYNTVQSLTDLQFKGTAVDNANGIFYGVKGASEAGYISDMHEADYTYYPPTGGDGSPYRITDFIGYDHYAKPALYCLSVPEKVYYNVKGSLSVAIDYDYNGTNTTGLNINDFLPSNEAKDIGDYYPCVLVDGWARALYNVTVTSGSTPVYTPLKYNNTWFANFATTCDVSALEVAATRTVTFFMIRSIYGASSIYDLREWTNVALTASNERGYAIPEGIALQIPFSYYTQTIPITNIDALQSLKSVIVSWDFPEEQPENGTKFKVSIQAWNVNKTQMYGLATTDWTKQGITRMPEFTLQQLGLDSFTTSTQVRFIINIIQYRPDGVLYPDGYSNDVIRTITPV